MGVNFEIAYETIPVGSGALSVRGMNSEDVTFLLTTYMEDATQAVARYGKKYGGSDGVIPRSAVAALVSEIAQNFPSMAAEIISRCADAPEEIDKIRRLPFIKQVQALKAIAVLSVDDGPELKNWIGVLVDLLEANGLQLGPLSNQLRSIIGTSVNQ